MSWAWWLAVPVVATSLAAIWSWLRARPAGSPDTGESMHAHREYLDALAQTARSREVPPREESGESG